MIVRLPTAILKALRWVSTLILARIGVESDVHIAIILDEFFDRLACRIFGHPGPIWHTSYGNEPDYRCRRCRNETVFGDRRE